MALQQYRGDLPYVDDYLLPGSLVYLDEVHKLYVERRGDGPPLLLLPGLGGDAGELAPLRDRLAADFATIVIDRRGFSRSPRGWNKCNVDRQADDLAALIDVFGIGPVHVFAAGAAVPAVLRLWLRHPRRVAGGLLHEPWIPALAGDGFADWLAAGEAAVQAARSRRNTGPFEARLRLLMGAGFEAMPTEVRARLVKNGEMHAVENVFAWDWLPPPAALLPARRDGWAVSVGGDSPPAMATIAATLARRYGLPLTRVGGRHAAWLDDADGYLAAVRPQLRQWLAAPGE